MNKKKRKTNLIRNLIFFTILLLSGILTLISIYTYKTGFTVLQYNQFDDFQIKPSKGLLYKDNSIKGKIEAQEDNLGVIGLNLHNYNDNTDFLGRRIEEDTLIFRLKEVGSKEWYYEHKYSGGQFHELKNFPFGFIPIKNSKGKLYEFEVISLNGNNENKLTLSNNKPQLISQYKYDKSRLLNDKKLLLDFSFRKVLFAFSNLDFYPIIVIYLLPLLLFSLWISPLGQYLYSPISRYIKSKQKIYKNNSLVKFINSNVNSQYLFVDFILFFGFLIDILLIDEFINLVTIILLIVYVIRIYIFSKNTNISFNLALLFLILIPFLLLLNLKIPVEKTSTWVYLIMSVGVIHSLVLMQIEKIK